MHDKKLFRICKKGVVMLIITMFLISVGILTFMSLLAILLIKLDNKKLRDPTDFISRINNGEVLNRKNIF